MVLELGSVLAVLATIVRCSAAGTEVSESGTVCLLAKQVSTSRVVVTDESDAWAPQALDPLKLEAGQHCTNHQNFRAFGAWRFEQNGSMAGTVEQCASLVAERGPSVGCTSGLFHFAEGPDGDCGCATDGCAVNSRTAGARWDIYLLKTVPLPGTTPDGLPDSPAGAQKIWEMPTGPNPQFKVMQHGCEDSYRHIIDSQECRRAGNALNIEPYPIEDLPKLNANIFYPWLPPAPYGLVDINVPFFEHGCLVGPGGNRGRKINGFTSKDALWFNENPQGAQSPSLFFKHRICANRAQPCSVWGFGLGCAVPDWVQLHGGYYYAAMTTEPKSRTYDECYASSVAHGGWCDDFQYYPAPHWKKDGLPIYSGMDGRTVNGVYTRCDDADCVAVGGPHPLPAGGWELVPEDADVAASVIADPTKPGTTCWGTHGLVFSNGKMYSTSSGQFYRGGELHGTPGNYHVGGGVAGAILMRVSASALQGA